MEAIWHPVSAAPTTAVARGQGLERSDVAVRKGQLASGNGQPSGMSADRQDDAVGPPTATVAGSQRVRIGEANRPEVLDEVDPVMPQLVGEVLFLNDVAGDSIAVGQDCLQVGLGRRSFETEYGPRGPVSRQPCGPSHRAHRCRTSVEVGAPDLIGFQQCDCGVQLAGLHGRGDTGGSPSDDQDLCVVDHVVRRPAVGAATMCRIRPGISANGALMLSSRFNSQDLGSGHAVFVEAKDTQRV